MKANELMIGDWLKHYNGTPMQVTKITTEHFACAENGGVNCWEYNNKFEPIPLTIEILEKNGFEYNKQKVIIPSRSQEDTEIEYMYCKELRCSFDIIHGYLMFNSNIDLCNIRMVVNYVHELQHIFRLGKIDKEIII